MALKKSKPYTPSRRFTVRPAFEEITKDRPERSLLVSKPKSSGRNNQGRITIRHRGGGQIHRRLAAGRPRRDLGQ